MASTATATGPARRWHVRVVAAGLRAVVDSADLTGAINLAGTDEISAVELAGRGTIRHIDQRTPQTHRELADGARTRDGLGWTPQSDGSDDRRFEDLPWNGDDASVPGTPRS